MGCDEDVLAALRSIDATLKALLALSQQRAPKRLASDADLDGPYGDPVLKFTPRAWVGPSCKGSRFSQCPPELLDLVAETYDYFAAQSEEKDERTDKGKPVADYKRQDASRARGWAKRLRAGYRPPATQRHGSVGAEWGADQHDGF